MIKPISLAVVLGLGLLSTPAAHAWISYIDFEEQLFPDAEDPHWIACNAAGGCTTQEGGASFVDVGGSIAFRLDSPDRSSEPSFPDQTSNEYYAFRFGEADVLAGSRFRLVDFTPAGKENILMATVGGITDPDGNPVGLAPSITLVDGNFWVWSYTSDDDGDGVAGDPILDLGPADNEWHEAYVLALNDATTTGKVTVLWDGTLVVDGAVVNSPDFDGYVEFGSGGYWQGNAGSTVDFDWVGSGNSADLPVPPAVTGDYNNDGKVDAADYVVWRKSEGTTNTLPNDPVGGTIGQSQYDNWRANFGMMAAGAGQNVSAIPEPATSGLLLAAILAGLIARRVR